MHGFVATTDQDWYKYSLTRPDLDEVNFWAPSGKAALGTVPFGAPFFFKLKHPHNAIGGFGFLGPITTIPLSLAWEAFGQKNGAPDRATMHARIRKYRGADLGPDGRPNPDPPVGCRTILQPVFFPPETWVPVPSDWSPNIVQGKTYDLSHGEGRRMWEACCAQAQALAAPLFADLPAAAAAAIATVADATAPLDRYGADQLIRPRLGQGAFRLAVTEAYARSCAATGEHSLPVLDAAHIRPFADGGAHEIPNGLLLRADLHRLYDAGYVTVTPDYEFRVSAALRDEYANGRLGEDLELALRDRGRTIRLPANPAHRPDRERLGWHVERVFRG